MSTASVSSVSETCWKITLASPPDNRLTPAFLTSLGHALDEVEQQWRTGPLKDGKGGSVILSSGITKFFSNGLDYQSAIKDPNFFPEIFDPVILRVLTFPLVTVAAISGHAFAGGFILALACDFRVIISQKAWCCMNEIAFGAPLPPMFASLLSHKHPSPQVLRKTLLGHRWTAQELMDNGLVDALAGAELVQDPGKGGQGKDLLHVAVDIAEKEGAKVGAGGGAWGGIKSEIFRPVIEASMSRRAPSMPHQEAKAFKKRMEVKAKL